MPFPLLQVTPIDRLNSEWNSLGRSRNAVRVLHLVADLDANVGQLVYGLTPQPQSYSTPYELVDFMTRTSGRLRREQAAAVVRAFLRESDIDPLVSRFLIQALIPGMLTVASKLRWGQGGDWDDANHFLTELISTTWEVLSDWSGQDRPYAVLDVLSAARCRVRRQLFRERDLRRAQVRLTPNVLANKTSRSETDLEELSRLLIDLRQQGMKSEEVQVMYAQHVLGYSISELASVTGRSRRALYARRDRGQRRLCA